MTPSVTVRAPAKINLHLAVGPLRDDHYHEVATVFQALSLYDEVIVTPAPSLSISVAGEGAADVPTDSNNLAAQAVKLLAAHTGHSPDIHISINKSIPVAAGLAGGSADAAAALVACDALWGTRLPKPVLQELASGLGSDVPFLLSGGIAVGTGRGNNLSPVLARGTWHWVLAFSQYQLSAKAVYAELDRLRSAQPMPPICDIDQVLAALHMPENPSGLGKVLGNDLQPAAIALCPSLRTTLRTATDEGALGAIVSGSGPTCGFLARDEQHAVRLAASLAGLGICRTVRTTSGPVSGTRVM